jgi:hypothetical protein
LLKVIAFLELLAACIVSASFNFFVFLLLFLVLGVATFASSEIRQSRKRGYSPARITGAGVTGAIDRRRGVRFARHPGDHRPFCSSSCRAPRAPLSSTWYRIAIIWRVSRTTSRSARLAKSSRRTCGDAREDGSPGGPRSGAEVARRGAVGV